MPIASVTLSDGHGPGERADVDLAPSRSLGARDCGRPDTAVLSRVREWCSLMLGTTTLHGGALMNEGLRIT
jgi:hypothetical protein